MIRFIHIPKTGGTSLVNFLKNNNIEFLYGDPPKGVGKHRPAKFWINESSFKFTIVRNPYNRIVSFYNFIKPHEAEYSFEDFVKNKLISTNTKIHNPWTLQTEYVYDDNLCIVDKLFYLENNIDKSIKDFFSCNNDYIKINVSTHNSYESYYTEELKEIIYNHFKKDFLNFGYNK